MKTIATSAGRQCGKSEELNDIAAIYVERTSTYKTVQGIDCWDEDRDARRYAGSLPVVAHPPCQRWGRMYAGQPAYIARTGIRKVLGDDGGCFRHAIDTVRRVGGVIEHPYMSKAWEHFGIAKPPRSGGWVQADDHGGFTCYVEQGYYGHYAPKPTWLYVVGVTLEDLPALKWGVRKVLDSDFPDWAMKKWGRKKCRRAGLLAFQGGGVDSSARNATPEAFRDVLIDLARSVRK